MKRFLPLVALACFAAAPPAAADVLVPNLTGRTVDEAAAKLRAVGLRPEGGQRLQANGTTFAPGPAGRVTSQSIAPGRRVPEGVTVAVGTTATASSGDGSGSSAAGSCSGTSPARACGTTTRRSGPRATARARSRCGARA